MANHSRFVSSNGVRGDFRPGYSEDPRNSAPSAVSIARLIKSPNAPASCARKRKWAGDGIIPPRYRSHFTQGEAAAITVILKRLAEAGTADWCNDKIAAIAGVSKRTVQYALKKAEALRMLIRKPRRLTWVRNLPNVIRATCPELVQWLRRREKQSPLRVSRPKPKANPPIGCKDLHCAENPLLPDQLRQAVQAFLKDRRSHVF